MFGKYRCTKQQCSKDKVKSQFPLRFNLRLIPGACAILVKCKKPRGTLTVLIWLLYHHLNFRYCTICKWDRIMDRQTDRQIMPLALFGNRHINIDCLHLKYSVLFDRWKIHVTGNHMNETITRGVTVMGCATAKSFYCKGFCKVTRQENIKKTEIPIL